MLTTNVLCMKKRKKRRYCVSDVSDYGHRPNIEKRTPGSVVSMMHITEDTPPDMLAGAMDLTVHLPSGRAVKMSVERSTPMMDLLVQIVTAHQLQLSGHIIQALEMAPSAGISDRILPYKPNTPIGALDTQHIKVVPKNRNLPASKIAAPGHQPFESTFRLKVHLPRNQLYVVRVSQYVYLEDIMNKVCKEKDLDPVKYEFRHPGNLDEVLDPKLTLSDYKITEIYVVSKGTGRLTQAFSTSDIMALRKEEERKQFQAKTGGGVFNLIFKRGKPSGGTGSVSSDNRSISPIQSDDSRSVTPPTVQPQILKEIPPEKPKPPQRKRRQAPKPPSQISEEKKPPIVEKPPSQISNNSDTSSKKGENGLLICHSRNSSDSSGYHEASILSDHCNTSLPRRPRTMIVNEDVGDGKLSGEHSKSTGNLAKMSLQSKSTSSLAIPGRKKKAAPPPPPPPVLKAESSVTKTENASPVVASQPVETQKVSSARVASRDEIPVPLPRRYRTSEEIAHSVTTSPETSSETLQRNLINEFKQRAKILDEETETYYNAKEDDFTNPKRKSPELNEAVNLHHSTASNKHFENMNAPEVEMSKETSNEPPNLPEQTYVYNEVRSLYDTKDSDSYVSGSSRVRLRSRGSDESLRSDLSLTSNNSQGLKSSVPPKKEFLKRRILPSELVDQDSMESMDSLRSDTSLGSNNSKPEIVGVIPKKRNTLSRKRGFQIGSSMLNLDANDDVISINSASSDFEKFTEFYSLSSETDFEMSDVNEDMFKRCQRVRGKPKEKRVCELVEINDLDKEICKSDSGIVKNQSGNSLRSLDSIPGFMGVGNMKKWQNLNELDDISMLSNSSLRNRPRWFVGDTSDTESVSTAPTNQTSPESLSSPQAHSANASASTSSRTSASNLQMPRPEVIEQEVNKEDVDKQPKEITTADQTVTEKERSEQNISVLSTDSKAEADSGICENISTESIEKEDLDWQYQIPSPPKGFRDTSPNHLSNCDAESLGDHKPDSVVSNPELFEKLKRVRNAQRDSESDIASDITNDDKDNEICNKLSLENLEKRKSLVYNRELATSLKYAQEEPPKSKVLNELEDVIGNQKSANLLRNSKPQETFKTYDRNLPNFKISTYDAKKEKINIFEDDTIRSNSENKQATTHFNQKSDVSATEKPLKRNSYNGTSMENIAVRRSSKEDKQATTHFNQKSDVSATEKPMKRNSYTGSSMENIAVRRSSKEEMFKKPQEAKKYRPKSMYDKHKVDENNVERSESFSITNNWTPLNPVKRSKSQVALNRYKEEINFKTGSTDNLSKSNSLFDVSGLQSLEVIRMIQTKLSNSKEQLDHESSQKVTAPVAGPPVKEAPVQKLQQPPRTLESTPQAPPPKVYYSPPSINLGTWSQRPKTQVQLKEDTDYKFSTASSKMNAKVNTYEVNSQNSGVSIKINGADPILPQKSGNVVIKIGGAEQSRQINDVSSRYPLTNVNRTRPHSIALDSHFDISHVPIVRSVELKKPFKDLQTNNNTSITQIYQDGNSNFKLGNNEHKSLNYPQNLESVAKGTENKNSLTYFSNESGNKTVFRNNVFVPVVKGFKTEGNVNKKTWSVYGTLPTKTSENLNTNQNVPFSQSNLRRTESNKIIGGNVNNNNIFGNVVLRNAPVNSSNSFRNSYGEVHKIDSSRTVNVAPPPPQMPKIPSGKSKDLGADQRKQLLDAIRNFGGKKGLRTTKG